MLGEIFEDAIAAVAVVVADTVGAAIAVTPSFVGFELLSTLFLPQLPSLFQRDEALIHFLSLPISLDYVEVGEVDDEQFFDHNLSVFLERWKKMWKLVDAQIVMGWAQEFVSAEVFVLAQKVCCILVRRSPASLFFLEDVRWTERRASPVDLKLFEKPEGMKLKIGFEFPSLLLWDLVERRPGQGFRTPAE